MLRSFRVENHKSIRDEQELVFIPQYDKTKPAVPVTAILGANASGKSNLLDALRWLRDAVRHSYAGWEAGTGVPRAPFLLDTEQAAEPSGYAVDVTIDGLRHNYGVVVDDAGVREEWLSTYPKGRRRVVFERDRGDLKIGSMIADRRAIAELLTRQTRDNALFLGVAAQNDVDDVQGLYRWFREEVTFGDVTRDSGAEIVRRLEDERERAALVSLIRAADLGVEDVFVVETLIQVKSTAAGSAGARRRYHPGLGSQGRAEDGQPDWRLTELGFRHRGGRAPLGIADQSAGTRSWMTLVAQALAVLDKGGVLVIDEVDASLHPHLSAQLIRLFKEPETNGSGAQLIFTTHDPTLLDDDVLARDEIWFVEKNTETGASTLYPLTQFHPRKNEDTAGRYLAGAYGAVPVLSGAQFRDALRRRWEGDEAARR